MNMFKFQGFTEKANNALNLAVQSAERFGHNYVGTEHILLGLLKEGSGMAYTALTQPTTSRPAPSAYCALRWRLPPDSAAAMSAPSTF